MSSKPGLERAIPAAILGFIAGCLLVVLLRAFQSMDPLWDVSVAIVVAPFTMAFAFIWGMGGFDPRMSEHAHGPDHDSADAGDHALATVAGESALAHADSAHEEHHEAEVTPVTVLGMEIWRVATLLVILLVVLFGFAMLPTGLTLIITDDPEASAIAFDTDVTMLMPLGQSSIEVTQLGFFTGFIIFTFVSLFAVAGGLGFLFYYLNRNIKVANATQPTPQQLIPPAPVRFMGRMAGSMARGLRALPRFFGQK
jgi:hypothetical protein